MWLHFLPPSYTQPCIVDGIACGDYKEAVQNQNIFAHIQYTVKMCDMRQFPV